MRFMCLVYIEHGALDALSTAERTRLADDSIEADHRGDANGSLLAAGPLEPPTRAVTIAQRNGRVIRTDGPFMETKEWLAGFFLIQAADMDGAIASASGSPVLRVGRVEIRPMVEETHSVTGVGRPR